MLNILLIEDEPGVTGFLKKGLEEQLFQVKVAYDGMTGLEMAVSGQWDIIILDVILPKINGWDLCRKLRAEFNIDTPVLMLSALGETNHIVKGLNGGADDYLAKPFKLDELIARITALYRRNRGIQLEKRHLSFGEILLDLDSKDVFRNDKKIKLTAQEFKLLEYFMRNPGRVLSRMQILQQVWGIDFNLGTNVVDVYINYLRKKIDKGFESKLLHTVIGMGYVLKQDND